MSESSRVTTDRLGTRTLLSILLLLAPLSFLTGCGSGQTNSGQTGSVPVNLAVSFPQNSTSTASASTLGSRIWATLQPWLPSITSAWAVGTVNDLASLTVEVSAPDLLSPITKTVSLSAPTSGQVITLTLDIPVGSNRVFTVSCLDATRVRIFKGTSSPVTLSGGQAATVDIALTAAGVANPLTTARDNHTVTLLPNGQVLAVGGCCDSAFGNLASAELFDPATKQWSKLASSPTTIQLQDLLIPGASFTQGDKLFDNFSLSISPPTDPEPAEIQPNTVTDGSGLRDDGFAIFVANGVEDAPGDRFISTLDYRVTVLDPAYNIRGGAIGMTFAGTGDGSLIFQISLFADAQRTQLLAGLNVNPSATSNVAILNQGFHQLFVRATFTEVGPLSAKSLSFQTTFLRSLSTVSEPTPVTPSSSSLIIAREGHTATLLQNGQVLVVGGFTQEATSASSLASAELFDPATKTWTLLPTGLTTGRSHHTATLLQNGQVLVVGGEGLAQGSTLADGLASAELFDPATKTWSPVPSLSAAHNGHTATLLQNGQVLVAGGADSGETDCEVFDPSTKTWSPVPSLTNDRSSHTATLLQNGQVLVVGGSGSIADPMASAELFDPATKTWTPLATGLTTARSLHTATLLQKGQVLVVGGNGGAIGTLASAELFDPATKTWTPLATGLTTARDDHTATLLQEGQVLISGGTAPCFDPGCIGTTASTELFDLALP